MPPPIFQLGKTVILRTEVAGRVCLGKGHRKCRIPPGRYMIMENARNEDFWHNGEKSDGYTYRIVSVDAANPLRGKRVSVWQSDLLAGLDEPPSEG